MGFHLIDRMAVEDEGDGDAVVCVHGLGGTSNTFTPLMGALARHRVVRMAPGGEILESISTGDQGAFACTLGGPDGRTLFICVAPDFLEHARQAAREAAIWTTTVNVPGAGRP